MPDNIEDRELRIRHTFNAPISIVWQAWTNPDQIIHWWGPSGFTSTIHVMDLREGGDWRLTLHEPDGTNYPNRSVFKEIVPFKKIAFEHFNPHFRTTVLFEEQGNETIINWSMIFETVELFDIVVKVHKADKGQKENIERLEAFLAEKVN